MIAVIRRLFAQFNSAIKARYLIAMAIMAFAATGWVGLAKFAGCVVMHPVNYTEKCSVYPALPGVSEMGFKNFK